MCGASPDQVTLVKTETMCFGDAREGIVLYKGQRSPHYPHTRVTHKGASNCPQSVVIEQFTGPTTLTSLRKAREWRMNFIFEHLQHMNFIDLIAGAGDPRQSDPSSARPQWM